MKKLLLFGTAVTGAILLAVLATSLPQQVSKQDGYIRPGLTDPTGPCAGGCVAGNNNDGTNNGGDGDGGNGNNNDAHNRLV